MAVSKKTIEDAATLRKLRARCGLTVEEFCTKFGFNIDKYNKWETACVIIPHHIATMTRMILAYEFACDTVLPLHRYRKPVTVLREMIEKSDAKHQTEFANKYGISQHALSSFVNGRIIPRFYFLSMLENLMLYEREFGDAEQYMYSLEGGPREWQIQEHASRDSWKSSCPF